MIFTIITHAVAFLAGAGVVFAYLHKHQTAAVTAATTLASEVAKIKADIAPKA